MVIGDPGVGKTTIILDLMANIHRMQPNVKMLFISAEMNEIDLSIYVQRYPKFGELDIMFIEAEFDSETVWAGILLRLIPFTNYKAL